MTVFIDGHTITCTVDEYIELRKKLNKDDNTINKKYIDNCIDPGFYVDLNDNVKYNLK